MNLIKMEGPRCLLYAAAMVLDASPETLMREVGHNGMAKIWPKLNPPLCYRNFHMQEIIDCFVARGRGLMPIEFDPANAPTETARPQATFENYSDRFYHHLEGKKAICIGRHVEGAVGHAWAWDGETETCYDPSGFLANLDDYIISEAWIMI